MTRPFFILLTMLLLVSGCKKTSTAPTPTPTTTPELDSVAMFTGTLSARGVQIYPFTTLQTTTAKVTFASLVASGTTSTLSLPMTIGLGTPSADLTTCNSTTTVTTSPALTTQITQSLSAGSYCVVVADTGSLSGDATFGIRITQTTVSYTQGQAGTETFSSNLYPGGAINRTFAVSATGPIRVTLSGVSPASGLGVGLGVTSNAVNCYLHTAVVSTPGSSAELNATGDPDSYCVRVFDPGTLAQRVVFQIQIAHQ